MKKVYLIIIAYAFISLILIANLGGTVQVEDESIDYDLIESSIQVNYSPLYSHQLFDDNTPVFDAFINVGKAFSNFGKRSFFSLQYKSGIKAVDTLLNLFILPCSIVVNCCQLVYELFAAICNIPVDEQSWTSQVSTWSFYQNDFSSGSSYGGGGGGVSGGR